MSAVFGNVADAVTLPKCAWFLGRGRADGRLTSSATGDIEMSVLFGNVADAVTLPKCAWFLGRGRADGRLTPSATGL